jgi:hypothetical protein
MDFITILSMKALNITALSMDLTKTLSVTKLIITMLRSVSFSTMDLDGTINIMTSLSIMTTSIASLILSVILFLSMMYIIATSILIHSVYVY